jgi:hypothetical protein
MIRFHSAITDRIVTYFDTQMQRAKSFAEKRRMLRETTKLFREALAV